MRNMSQFEQRRKSSLKYPTGTVIKYGAFVKLFFCILLIFKEEVCSMDVGFARSSVDGREAMDLIRS